jgi:hypothetical protein
VLCANEDNRECENEFLMRPGREGLGTWVLCTYLCGEMCPHAARLRRRLTTFLVLYSHINGHFHNRVSSDIPYSDVHVS